MGDDPFPLSKPFFSPNPQGYPNTIHQTKARKLDTLARRNVRQQRSARKVAKKEKGGELLQIDG